MNIPSLYIHVPFCRTKCSYCAFYSIQGTPHDYDAYSAKIIQDIMSLPTKTYETIYIGGGTPTIMPFDQLSCILNTIRTHLTFSTPYEFTIEANPDTLTKDIIALLADTGINRISMGIQSFNESLRSLIGRHGSIHHIETIIAQCSHHHITNLSADLIYGIPTQTCALFEEDLKRATELPIKHLSLYALSIEDKTRLHETLDKTLIDDDEQAAMWELTDTYMATHTALKRYEISNCAIPGYECRHNLNFWQGKSYCGLGPSAVSTMGTTRHVLPSDLKDWLSGHADTCTLTTHERAVEILALCLRTVDGIESSDFQHASGLCFSDFHHTLMSLQNEGLITYSSTHAAPTSRGLLFGDHIAREVINNC